ncbi:expressed unknown protein [Seminavis robusta]|uniref:Uncharacterized protein n=1 Tax=Seminavis robusta TaxID=568900 RepID=A0A9N8D6K0_9STRA|nr:expressed unknown protein [Seminavis robusta]|eukprot:Sro13_g010040.1 n/a (186) ;mRNA; f:103169-103726
MAHTADYFRESIIETAFPMAYHNMNKSHRVDSVREKFTVGLQQPSQQQQEKHHHYQPNASPQKTTRHTSFPPPAISAAESLLDDSYYEPSIASPRSIVHEANDNKVEVRLEPTDDQEKPKRRRKRKRRTPRYPLNGTTPSEIICANMVCCADCTLDAFEYGFGIEEEMQIINSDIGWFASFFDTP